MDGLVMLGGLYNWRKPRQVRLTPKEPPPCISGWFLLLTMWFSLLPAKGLAERFSGGKVLIWD